MKNIFIALMLVGCATTYKKMDSAVTGWVGKSEDELVSTIGPPTSSMTTDSGLKIYQYLREGGTATNLSKNWYTGEILGSQQVRVYCKSQYVIDAAHIVTRATWEGNGCPSD